MTLGSICLVILITSSIQVDSMKIDPRDFPITRQPWRNEKDIQDGAIQGKIKDIDQEELIHIDSRDFLTPSPRRNENDIQDGVMQGRIKDIHHRRPMKIDSRDVPSTGKPRRSEDDIQYSAIHGLIQGIDQRGSIEDDSTDYPVIGQQLRNEEDIQPHAKQDIDQRGKIKAFSRDSPVSRQQRVNKENDIQLLAIQEQIQDSDHGGSINVTSTNFQDTDQQRKDVGPRRKAAWMDVGPGGWVNTNHCWNNWPNDFPCSYKGRCLSQHKVCDGKVDCKNGTDEKNCYWLPADNGDDTDGW